MYVWMTTARPIYLSVVKANRVLRLPFPFAGTMLSPFKGLAHYSNRHSCCLDKGQWSLCSLDRPVAGLQGTACACGQVSPAGRIGNSPTRTWVGLVVISILVVVVVVVTIIIIIIITITISLNRLHCK